MSVLDTKAAQYRADVVCCEDMPADMDEWGGSMELAFREGWAAAARYLLTAADLASPAVLRKIEEAI